MRRLSARALLALLLLLALATPAQAASVYVTEIDGVVSAGTVDVVRNSVSAAEEGGHDALLVEINTDGGLVKATREINQEMSNSDVPVVTYVTPRGGRAFSAGTFILMNGHVAAMAPETQIGAATPIQLGTRGEPNPAEQKVVNAMAVYLRDIAESRSRNATRAEQYVLEGETDTSRSAVERGVVDLVASSRDGLLHEIDGRTVQVKDEEVTLETAGASVTVHEPSPSAGLKDLISDPQVVFLLFTIGLLGIWFGIQNPGLGAEVVGVVSLVLALYGMGTFSSSTLAVVLIGLSAVLFVAELLTPTFGFLAAAGILTLLIGGLMLPSEPLMPRNWYGQFTLTVAGASIGLGGFALFAAAKILEAREKTPFIREKLLVGSTGEVVDTVEPGGEGKIRARGSIWSATSDHRFEPGDRVEVTDMRGLTVVVEEPGE